MKETVTKIRKLRIFILLVTFMTLILLFGGGASTNALESPVMYQSGHINPVQYPFSGPPSSTQIYPYKITSLPGGGEEYWYRIGSTVVSYPVPPENGLNPLTVSDQVLQDYGLPPRPNSTDKVVYDQWKKLITSIDIVSPMPSITNSHS